MSEAVQSDTERPKRLTLSQIVEMLLTRTARERSAVTLGRSVSGETQIEVSVRTGDDSEVVTVEDAERKAREVYDRLREQYPLRNGHDHSEITLTRNAKGETQVAISMKSSDEGAPTLQAATDQVRDAYDTLRMKYPMTEGGLSAKPGSVA